MPVTTTPTIIEEKVEVIADTFTIRAFKPVMPDNPENMFMEIYIDAGTAQPDGSVDWHNQTMRTLDGADLAAAMNTVTTGGSIYDEVKSALYAACQVKGWIPA